MKCKIITTSKQCELDGVSLFDNTFFGNEPIYEANPYNGIDPSSISSITTYFDGELLQNGDDVRVIYDEVDQQGDVSQTIVAFNLGEPREVTITRSGSIETIMLFSEGQRTISVYQTPFMPFELGIYAKKVSNRLLEDGVLEISYIVEIKGAVAQKTELKLEVKQDD